MSVYAIDVGRGEDADPMIGLATRARSPFCNQALSASVERTAAAAS